MDQIHFTVCDYLYSSPRGRFSRNTYKKALAVVEVYWWHFHDLTWEDEMRIFLEKLNNFYASIKFTSEYSREKVNYLDVQVTFREGKLITDLYVKQTDSH